MAKGFCVQEKFYSILNITKKIIKMKTLLKKLLFIITLLMIASCNNDDDNNSTSSDSREVKYEVTGNAIGTYDVVYITGSNTGSSAIPTSLPWTKDIVAQDGPFAATMTASVSGATPGQTITARIYVGGKVKKEQTETVQSNGLAIIASLQYLLK